MSIFYALKSNKGTVSSALGKQLAADALAGDHAILTQAVHLSCYDKDNAKAKSIRAGAAKIVELVAEKSPALVAPQLKQLFEALEVTEPQTRWMIIRTFGYCAALDPQTAAKGLPFAEKYLREKAGVCLSGAAEYYLGEMGALSKGYAGQCFPLLMRAFADPLPNETDWIMEALLRLLDNLDDAQKAQVLRRLCEYKKQTAGALRKSTVKRMEALNERIQPEI